MVFSGRARFEGGANMAMKLPPNLFAETVSFYRDRLRLPVLEEEETEDSVVFAFGHQKLWLDRTAGINRAEIWLELLTDDPDGAADILADFGAGEVEPLCEGLEGFWVRNPAGVIHLVLKR